MEPDHQRIPFDDNRRVFLTALSYLNGTTSVPLYADPATGALLIEGAGSGGTSSNFGAPFPTAGTAIGATNGTDMEPLSVDGNGYLKVNVETGSVGINDGTNTANVAANDSTTAGNTGNFLETGGTGYTTGTLTLNSGSPITSWFDMLNYAGLSLEILTNSSGAVLTFETSGDSSQTNTTNTPLTFATSGISATSTSATETLYGPRTGRYFRIASNVSGAATVTCVLTFFTQISAFPVAVVNQNGIWNVGSNSATGSAVPANAFYIGINNASGNLTGLQSLSAQIDSIAGNTSLSVGSFVYNGSSWDRMRGINGAVAAGTGTVANAAVPHTNTTASLSQYTGSLSNTAVAVKASAGGVYGYFFYNNNSTQSYIQFWNTAQGSVTVGTTAPVYSLGIPANGAANLSLSVPISHSTAITIAATTTRAGSTAPSNNIDANVFYF